MIIYYMCVTCGYEIAGFWVRNGMVLGTKWYEFWVRNGMSGVGISTAPALHPYCSICVASQAFVAGGGILCDGYTSKGPGVRDPNWCR